MHEEPAAKPVSWISKINGESIPESREWRLPDGIDKTVFDDICCGVQELLLCRMDVRGTKWLLSGQKSPMVGGDDDEDTL